VKIKQYLFSFETLMVLFLTAGRFKADPRFQWIPIDLTVLFFGLSIVAGIAVLLRKGRISKNAIEMSSLGILFVSWICISLLWTEGTDYANKKALYSATLLLWPLVGMSLITAQEKIRVQRLFVVFVVISLLVAFDTMMLGITRGFGAVAYLLDGAYLGIGRVLGMGAGIVLVWSATSYRKLHRIVCLALFFMYVFVLAFSGGKGPLIAVVLASISPFIAQPLVKNSYLFRLGRNLMIVFVLAIVGIIALVGFGVKMTTIERASFVMEDGAADSSTSERIFLYETAWDNWKEAPVIGKGIGSYPELIGRYGEFVYPHNIILEIGVETGLVGLSLFFVIILFGTFRFGLRGMYRDPNKMILMVLFINTLINAQFTEDLTGNRMLFAMTGLLLFGKTKQTLEQGNE